MTKNNNDNIENDVELPQVNHDTMHPLEDVMEIKDSVSVSDSDYETSFNQKFTEAIMEDEDLTKKMLLHTLAEDLYSKICSGYSIDFENVSFIDNIMILFNYGEKRSLEKLYNILPEFLKIPIFYQGNKDIPMHFWLESLINNISIKDIMKAFHIEVSQNEDITLDRTHLEPYCVILDAALQEFDFDTGKKNDLGIFTTFIAVKEILLELKNTRPNFNFNAYRTLKAFPERSHFLIEAISTVNLGSFLNGLNVLSKMVFGGPSDIFIKKISDLIINSPAYTLPIFETKTPLPEVTFIPLVKPTLFYTPFYLGTPID